MEHLLWHPIDAWIRINASAVLHDVLHESTPFDVDEQRWTRPQSSGCCGWGGSMRRQRTRGLRATRPVRTHLEVGASKDALNDLDYQPSSEQDAIAHWIETDCWRPPALPPTTFPAAPGNRKPSQVNRVKVASAERTLRSAAWFGLKDRRGMGDAVLHHSTLRPVIVREWSPDMQEYRGAIWNSQRTTKRFGQLAFSANLDTGSARVLSCASEDEPP